MSIDQDKYLTKSEREALSLVLMKYRATNLRDVLLIETALKCGGRASEVLALRKSDLVMIEDEQGNKAPAIRLLTLKRKTIVGKGATRRVVPKVKPPRYVVVKLEFYNRLKSYADSVAGDLIFPISYDRLDEIWKMYRPVAKKFHSLRHTFAILIKEASSHDLNQVKKYLGHASITSTMVYADDERSLTDKIGFAV